MGTAEHEVGTMIGSTIQKRTTPGAAAPDLPGRGMPGRWLLAILLACGLCPFVAQADGLYEQRFTLQPGWNAVFLEVAPEPEDVASALAGVPVASVWTWMPREVTVEFIQDPAEGLDVASGWLGYFPPPRPEAFLTNLFVLQANRAYLIKLDGSQPVTWTVRGRPSLRSMNWVADSFNLVGLHVDPSRPPTFGGYFADRSAHEGQPIYRLDPSGVWTQVLHPYSETVASGEAYWAYCDGPSDFDGPLEMAVEWGEDLDFGASLSDHSLVVRNRTVADTDITVRQLSSPNPVPLSVKARDEETGREVWAELPTTYAMPVPANQEVFLKLGVRRAELTADEGERVLEVTNGLGARRLVAVVAQRVHPTAPTKSAGRVQRSFKAVTTPFAGLWQGAAIVDAVSEAQMGGATPQPTGKALPLRLIIHVDSGGTVHLLKEVIEMWEEGTMVPDPDNPDYLITETPGRAVLLTNEDLIPDFGGIVLRDGVPVGLRISTTAYDFPDEMLEMDGTFDPGSELEVTVAMESESSTNPFKHSYHPDHNNLDEQWLNFNPEAYEVTRRMHLIFSESDPSGEDPPGWGDSVVGGTYFEEINGLHRNTIFVGGTFRLRRVAATPDLNR